MIHHRELAPNAGKVRVPQRGTRACAAIDRLARLVVRAALRRTRHGTLTLVESGARSTFGGPARGGPAVLVTVHDPRFYRSLLRGSLGAGDAYMDHWFDCSDLPELARLAALNMPALDRWRRAVRPVVALPQAAARWGARNTRRRARRNTRAHYDLAATISSGSCSMRP